MKLTKSELEIMNVLWEARRPLARNEILSLSSPDKSWKDSSIHILLNGLLGKDAIREDGFARSGKTFGRLYAPNISGEEYYASSVFSNGGRESLSMLFTAMLHSENISLESLEELERMVQKRKEELSK